MIGEGFLVFDGTPADGSASAYFDAIRLHWENRIAEVDLITAKIDDEAFGTEARDEDFYGLFGQAQGGALYLLHRNKRKATTSASGVIHPERRTTAAGGRWAHVPPEGMHLALEGAYQTGEYDGRDQRGAGGIFHWGWTARWESRPRVEVGGLVLSGDDPGTKRHEGWDGFYAEWPKYSELLVYTMYDNTTRIPDDDAGTWANLRAWWLEGRVEIRPNVRASIRATRLAAIERSGPGDGTIRGNLLALRADFGLLEGLDGQLLGEYFEPGDFYSSGADPAWYGRWQVTARF